MLGWRTLPVAGTGDAGCVAESSFVPLCDPVEDDGTAARLSTDVPR